jgi:hypothetical protein
VKNGILILAILQAALLTGFAGCHVMGDRHPSPTVAVEETTGGGRAYAWNPPGLVVSEKFAAFADPTAGTRQVPVKPIELATQHVRLVDFLDVAYGLPRIAIMPEMDRAVLRVRGPLEEYFPLPIVTRYGLGEVLVTDGDSVGLVDWTMALAEFDPVYAEIEPTNIQNLTVSVSGLVEKPGDLEIAPELPFSALTTSQLRLGSLAGDDERAAGNFISSNGVVIPDLYVITRLDRATGRLQKFYLPLQDAEEYGEEEFADPVPAANGEISARDRFAVFDNFRLQDGDAIEVTRAEFLPEIVSLRVSESTERVVEQHRREYQQLHERAGHSKPLGRLHSKIKSRKNPQARSGI